ncbi:MAG: Phosphate regulon transcriptional regulatory protein PhoB (SphR) [Anaerolineae bacterium]|jgi:DNA-binding response OmpR family regulator|nr:MAG: Phosphate regulon transcriptional regulatory protein PhoB (SphR) [Anaerolineae bacterium]
MSAKNILVIEDDEIVARTIERSLRGEEFKITVANSGIEGLKIARKLIPDIVILDVVMPGMDGYTVCREMRADPALQDVPILFLTAKIKDEDKIAGFNAGADDYLSKPFNIDELILRVRAILRRSQRARAVPEAENQIKKSDVLPPSVQSILQKISAENKAIEAEHCLIVGEYVLDTRSYEIYTPHKGKLRLTPVQYDLLYHLMSHPGQIFSPARLLDEVWDYPSDAGSPDLVRVHIKNLRERIEEDPSQPKFIRTVPGYGYTINPTDEN